MASSKEHCNSLEYIRDNHPKFYEILIKFCQTGMSYFQNDGLITVLIPTKEQQAIFFDKSKSKEELRDLLLTHLIGKPCKDAGAFTYRCSTKSGKSFSDSKAISQGVVELQLQSGSTVQIKRCEDFMPLPMHNTFKNDPHQVIYTVVKGLLNPNDMAKAEMTDRRPPGGDNQDFKHNAAGAGRDNKEAKERKPRAKKPAEGAEGGDGGDGDGNFEDNDNVDGGHNHLLKTHETIQTLLNDRVKEVLCSKLSPSNEGKISPTFLLDLVSFYQMEGLSDKTRKILQHLWSPFPISLWFTVFDSLKDQFNADINKWIKQQPVVGNPVKIYKQICCDSLKVHASGSPSGDVKKDADSIASAIGLPSGKIILDYEASMFQEFCELYKKIGVYRKLGAVSGPNALPAHTSQELHFYKQYVYGLSQGLKGVRWYDLIKNGDIYFEIPGKGANDPNTPQGLVDVFERSDVVQYLMKKPSKLNDLKSPESEVARISISSPMLMDKAFSFLDCLYASRSINISSLIATLKSLSSADLSKVMAGVK
jgi:hypothetical protein